MRLGLLSSLLSLLAITACATSAGSSANGASGSDPTADGGGSTDDTDDGDVANQPPHALGTITLGESHGVGAASKSAPVVSATFLPDAIASKSCATPLPGGCEIAAAPKCTVATTTATGCAANEVCTLDDSCNPTCKATPTCATACADDEVCTSASLLDPTGSCVKIQSFDAGPLAFSGTTTSLTMFPPYPSETTGDGAPFLGGSQLRVQAQGAVDVGFTAFDETFTATTFVQTSPSLAEVPRATVFGTGSVPIGWLPSTASTTDTVIVSVSGGGGTATCTVKDTDGQFQIPRAVVQAAQGATTATTTTTSLPVTISVTRQRREVHKDQKTKGTLTNATVQPNAWVELVTESTESNSFQGCTTAGESLCNDTCVETAYDTANCGACGNACTAGQTCTSGVCTGAAATCSSCRTTAESGACSSYYSSCSTDTDCYDLAACERACTTASCVTSCESYYPAGVSYIGSLKSCWETSCYSSCGF